MRAVIALFWCSIKFIVLYCIYSAKIASQFRLVHGKNIKYVECHWLHFLHSSLESIHYGWRRLPLQRWRHDTTWRGIIHVLKKLIVRRGCTVFSPLTWPFTKKFDGTKEFATTDSMDGWNVQPETQIVGTRLRVNTTRVLCVCGGFPSSLGSCRREVRV